MREQVIVLFKAADIILTYLRIKLILFLLIFMLKQLQKKWAWPFILDGKVSGVVGTHTHVQTADERILPDGTAYITDLGMAGALNSMIG